MFVITKDWLVSLCSIRGGFTKKQLEILGVEYPPVKGWMKKLIGNEIPDDWKLEIEILTQDEKRNQQDRMNRRPKFEKHKRKFAKTKMKRLYRLGKEAPKNREKSTWREQSEAFYKSEEWRRLRYKALQVCGGKCQCCGASKQDGKIMHVDHVKPRYIYPHLALEISNLQVLCEDCNIGKGAWDDTDWRTEDQRQQLQHMKNI